MYKTRKVVEKNSFVKAVLAQKLVGIAFYNIIECI